MPIDKKPFVSYTLDEDKNKDDKGEVISIRLNPEELRELEKDKERFNIGPDSAMLKLLVREGRKVIRTTLTDETVRYLISRRRTEYVPRGSRK